ncbi:MOSC domain-containing protein [Marivita sp. S6314]|uniref:MOSC domain-containing protein n=1 Tax=Marivita sp. S6314 TaxID=2926406 RepID=UPI001FF253BF|nr:MOSC N-terminal beta barrel domain-containing protein [Marivita sp. S6314]MCK0149750.1 MOSC domain-containing protein [Marivita sp. S6314]
MTGRIAEIWRHPIKSHGREPLDAVSLTPGKALPFDRHWAIAHERSDADGSKWVSCGHFCRVAKIPALMAISSSFDEATGQITLRHPDRAQDVCFNPDTEADTFFAWVHGFSDDAALQPTRIVKAATDAFTDSDFPSITLCNLSSHRAVEQRVGQPLSRQRWRGNIWIDGLAPWEEFDWDGRDIRIGDALLRVKERTDRCMSTHTNPDTGRRDAEVLPALDTWGHRDFSVRAEVIEGGSIAIGDEVARV